MMKFESDRLLSVKVLQQILQHKGSLSSLLPNPATCSENINPALVQEFCYGLCRHYYRLDYICTTLLEKPLRKKDDDIRCLILLGLYQLLFMRIPAHAAINETVATVNNLGKPWAKGLVNAILREAQRRSEELESQINGNFCYKFSHPDWLITTLKQSWPKHYQQILAANNEHAPMTLRLNLAKYSREEYIEILLDASIPAISGTLVETSIVLEHAVPVSALPGFAEGVVSVQDEASQLAAYILDLKPEQRVLDACAAPGGKTCSMLEREPELEELVALDCEEKRLARVQDNLDRIGLKANLQCADINEIDKWWDGKFFDRILLDVPCSGTGVIRRHPDIKLLRKAEDINELQQKQKAILDSVWPLLKDGGLLIYSTCSTILGENSHQIASFVDRTNNVKVLEIDANWGIECEYGRQLLPGAGNYDGFYYALLQKC